MKRSQGFTVIELIVVTIFLAGLGTILFVQNNNLAATQRDTDRKTAINAMYYNLEEVYFKKNKSYPSKIDSKLLTAMDPALFTDPNGIAMNDPASDYRYEGTNCNNNQCKSYSLRTNLEKEADYIKSSR